MSLVCLGLSHHTAPAEVRERHAFPEPRMSEALVALRDYEAVREAAMLSTCGRIEIYADVSDAEVGVDQLKQFLYSFRHGDVAYDIEPYLYTLYDADAATHVLRVATGLDSMLIGEAEILGQVKAAYDRAQRAGSLGSSLHRLFREALNAGKEARSRTTIGGESVSVATAAVATAKAWLGTLRGKTVALIGTGKMGKTTAHRLKLEGAGPIVVVNRTHERALEMVERLGDGWAVEFALIADALRAADVVITSTGSSTYVIDEKTVAAAMHDRPARELCIIDIAVPRDVDPAATTVPGVHVVDIDQLGATVDRTLDHRRRAIPLVEEIVEEHLRRYDRWNQTRPALPVISSLSRKAETIRKGEIDRLFSRCPELSDRQRMLIAGMSLTVISRLLHSAFSKMRERASVDCVDAMVHSSIIEDLFDLHLGETQAEAVAECPFPERSATRGVPPD